MEINLQLTEDFLTPDELERLRGLLGTKSDEHFQAALQNLALAALAEYKEMLLGMGLPSRAVEIRELRLLCLIRHYFKECIPSEAEVGSIFRLTESASRSLIRSVTSRFEYDLGGQVHETLKKAIANAQFDDDTNSYRTVIQSDNVLDKLNQMIESRAPGLRPITRVRGMARVYSISEDSYKVLRGALGVSTAGGGPQTPRETQGRHDG